MSRRKHRSMMSNGDYAPPNLGTCCICGTADDVRVVLMLNKKCPTPGRGWGCLVCGLPEDGAVAVLCSDCEGAYAIGAKQLAQVCTGHPARDGRTGIHAVGGTHEHDVALHVFEGGWESVGGA